MTRATSDRNRRNTDKHGHDFDGGGCRTWERAACGQAELNPNTALLVTDAIA